VNVANGNLVLQQTDSTPIQAHGKLGYVVRRTYNSEDLNALTYPGLLGQGWTLNVDQLDSAIGDAAASVAGMRVPIVESATNATPLTLVDRDGTRHVFRPRAVSVAMDVTDSASAFAGLAPKVLVPTAGYDKVLIDQLYDAPAGVHLGMWRYTEISSSCTPASCALPAQVLGWAAERPDRVRYEFSADGRELDMMDGNGVELRWMYESSTQPGQSYQRPLEIYEPRSCSLPLASTCRRMTFAYPNAQTVSITDPANRTTTYHLDTASPPHLTSVDNPDGTHLYYTYGGCGSTTQLCSATDPRGAATHFTYAFTTIGGAARITSLTDRRGNTTSLNYSTNDFSAYLTAVQGNHQQRFSSIDDSGRVGLVEEGDTSNNDLHSTTYFWDTSSSTCESPASVVDNNLCRTLKSSLNSDLYQDTYYQYNDEGRKTMEERYMGASGPAEYSTWGYHSQYFQAQGAVSQYDDTVTGKGFVASAGPPTGRTDPQTLFAISDETQSLPPRGNAVGAVYQNYLTTYKVDDNRGVAPNAIPTNGSCGVAQQTGNTGNTCVVTAPGDAGQSVTDYGYDSFGQRIGEIRPNAVAQGQTGWTRQYVYYGDADVDVSGNVSMGGWLKAVVDAKGRFVQFAYDRAGNVVRSWDRNATAGHSPTDPFTSFGSNYTETQYGAFAGPWRYEQSTRDPLGNQTIYTLDANGNRTSIRPPRGNLAGTASYDVTHTYDADDNQLTTLMPAEVAANKPTTVTYDQFGNATSATDPNGNVTIYQYDSVNRKVATVFTRGAWPTDTTTVPPACRESTTSDSPIPASRILCSTTVAYDGVDNQIAAQDGNHQTSTYVYDADHHQTTKSWPRNDGTLGTLKEQMVYDLDGHVTDDYPPRALTEGPQSAFDHQTSYDNAGLVASTSTNRSNATIAPANTTRYTYDADGNRTATVDPNGHVTQYTYDLNDRRLTQVTPRDASTTETTSYQYDAVGNTTAVIAPGNLITAYSFDADNRLLDEVQGADSTTAATAGLVDSAGGRDIRTRLAYDADGHVVAEFEPRAFASSTTTPDAAFMLRRDYDVDGREVTDWVPRYDSSRSQYSLTGLPDPGQCATGAAPQSISGVPGYPSTVGVCVTRASYDYMANPTHVTLPTSNGADNRYVNLAYTDDHLVSSVDAPSPATAGARVTADSYLYDADGKPVKVTDALGHQQTTAYNADETTSLVTDQPNGSLTHTTAYLFDADGNQTKVTDGRGLVHVSAYYADDRLFWTYDGAGDITTYTYDNAGNTTSVLSPSAHAKDVSNSAGTASTDTYTFDNLLLTSTDPVASSGSSLRQTTYAYDAAGRKLSQHVQMVDQAGASTSDGGVQSFSYYADNRLNSETGRTGTTISHQYDAAGNQTNATDQGSGSTLGATYYLDGLARTVTDGSRTSSYTYDGSGTVAARGETGGVTSWQTTYAYNDAELPSTMTSNATGSGSTTYIYLANGLRSHEVDPNGQTLDWSYNPDDTLSQQALKTSAGVNLATWSYTYDQDYQQLTQDFSGQGAGGATPVTAHFAYGYDGANRLTSFTNGSSTVGLSWDHNGNRLMFGTKTFSYNADNSIATFQDGGSPVQTFTYDAVGRLSGDGCATTSYDGFDRLLQATGLSNANCPTPQSASYSYDALDRQTSHTESGSTTTMHYDGLSQAVALESVSAGDRAFELDARGAKRAVTDPSAGVQYLTDDGSGNISTATDGSAAVQCSTRLDPFGTPVGGTVANPCNTGSTPSTYFYRGARQDITTGSYQFGARTYSPAKGAFLTPDSYRAAGSSANLGLGVDPLTANRYSYVNGDPVNLVDPTGHCAEYDSQGDPNTCWAQAEADGTSHCSDSCEKRNQQNAVTHEQHTKVTATNKAAAKPNGHSSGIDLNTVRHDAYVLAHGAHAVTGLVGIGLSACEVIAGGATALGVETGPFDLAPAAVAVSCAGYNTLDAYAALGTDAISFVAADNNKQRGDIVGDSIFDAFGLGIGEGFGRLGRYAERGRILARGSEDIRAAKDGFILAGGLVDSAFAWAQQFAGGH